MWGFRVWGLRGQFLRLTDLKASGRHLCGLPAPACCSQTPVSPGSDTICDLGGVNELANYGEYSGAPSEQQTYDYAKTILSLMTREKHPEGEPHTLLPQDGLTFCAGKSSGWAGRR